MYKKIFISLSICASTVYGMENKTSDNSEIKSPLDMKNKIKRYETSSVIIFVNGNITYTKVKKNNEIYAYIKDEKSGAVRELSRDEKYLQINYKALESGYNKQLKQSEKQADS